MEGKCALFKEFADVDAFPLCIDSKDTDTIVQTIYLISKSFGGINLEDIAAPRCFEIERRLKEMCDIPVFHDDQHGTAIVVAAALLNAIKVTKKEMGKLRIVINGAGAAGIAIGKHLINMGFGNVIMCDINGIICEGDEGLNPGQEEISHISNLNHEHGKLADALKDADTFIGVSRPNLVTKEMVSTMNNGIVFAMANPTPEIMPDEALAGGAAVVGTGRSDFPNQINNVLVFPGVFKGALSVRAKEITELMKQRASYAIASMIPDEELTPENIIASPLNKGVADVVAKAVADTAIEEGIAKFGGKKPNKAAIKLPLRDGDTEREDEAYAGHWFINANSKTAPQIVDKAVKPILDRDEVYSGCYARVSLNFYAFNSNGNKGIACGLGNIQKIRNGEPLGGRSSATDDFSTEEDDDFLS